MEVVVVVVEVVVLREEVECVHHLHFINGLHPLPLKRLHLRIIIIIALTVVAVVEVVVEWCPPRQVESFVNHAVPLALTESEVE